MSVRKTLIAALLAAAAALPMSSANAFWGSWWPWDWGGPYYGYPVYGYPGYWGGYPGYWGGYPGYWGGYPGYGWGPWW